MKKKKLKKWVKAAEITIEEYKTNTHFTARCAFCKLAKYDCSKCILELSGLICSDMPSYALLSNKQIEPRIRFHTELVEMLNTRISHKYSVYRELKDIKRQTWNVELNLNRELLIKKNYEEKGSKTVD